MKKQVDRMPPESSESTPSTAHLMSILEKETDFAQYVQAYEPTFIDHNVCKELDMLLRKYLVLTNEAVKASGIDRSYAYHIIAGKKKAGRDKLLRLAIAIGAVVADTQRLLRVAEQSELYPKVKRDAAIIHCIVAKKSVMETNAFLTDAGCPPLE